MKFWDAEQNAQHNLDATRLTLGSHKKVHWVCHECPSGVKHRWLASPNARKLGRKNESGCPFCSGHKACKCNSLQTLYPELAAEWDYQKNNTTPHDHTRFSCKEVWWTNHERGSWRQSLCSRAQIVWSRGRGESINSVVQPEKSH